MAANTPITLSKNAQDGVLQFYRSCYGMLIQHWNIREQMRMIDLAYIREQDWTSEHRKARIANRYGDSDKYQNQTVPVILPAVETAVTYQTSVFLTGVPIFGVVADPANIDAALQMETLIDHQAIKGGWNRELIHHFRNGFKYNIAALEVCWKKKLSFAVETDLNYDPKLGKPKEIIWEGNYIKNLDMYNTMWDTRVIPADVAEKGEFAGYVELMSRSALKSFIAELPDKIIENIKPALESGIGGQSAAPESYYIPRINPEALLNRNIKVSTDWMAWFSASNADAQPPINYKNLYEVTTLYARIIPSDFGIRVPSPNTPQVWKFIIVNNKIIIYAERQTNAHNLIPILFSQPLEDNLSYQTKSLAANVRGIQDITTALVNSVVAARRRAISDRTLYDPSRIRKEDINSDNPSPQIPVRPSAYGQDITKSVYPFPFRDDQTGVILQELPLFSKMSQDITGQNPAKQGQFVKGNKTQREFETVMGNANGRDQLISIMYEAQLFTPLKEIIKINNLQYAGESSYISRDPQVTTPVNVDPVALRKATLNFKISDGLVPSDKILSGDEWKVAVQSVSTSPALAQGYNLAPMFSYLMKTQGADLTPFEKSKEQMAYEQALGVWQQMKQLSIEKGVPFNDPQPLPEQFGYLVNQGTQPGALNGSNV